MEKAFYRNCFQNALNEIKAARAPRAQNTDSENLGWVEVERQRFFDFGGEDFFKCQQVIEIARMVSVSLLEVLLMEIAKEKGSSLRVVKDRVDDSLSSPIFFCMRDEDSKILYAFKDIEVSNFWKEKDSEDLSEYLGKYNCCTCYYVYFMFDKAYLQIINRNEALEDPGRDHNIYSFKWFFQEQFGGDEWIVFEEHLKWYISEVNSYIGYTIMRSLSPWALVNFKKITERKMMVHKYDEILDIKTKDDEGREYTLTEPELNKIQKQFKNDGLYRAMIGPCAFAESLITAEWLFDTMKKADAVDLTVIGTGYFKAVEQLLYSLIVLHRNDEPKRRIKKDYSFKEVRGSRVYLSEENIEKKAIDSTLGSMAMFIKDNIDVLRDDLGSNAKEFVREVIFDYKDLRNGYFHKDNIHDPEVVERIRDTSYKMFFLLLGSKDLSKATDKEELGIFPDTRTDFDKLCEYVDYHQGNILIFKTKNGNEYAFIAAQDPKKELVEGAVEYSGVYFYNLIPGGRLQSIREDGCPSEIYLGKLLGDDQADKINLTPTAVKKIYENGKYVGPSLAEENLEY